MKQASSMDEPLPISQLAMRLKWDVFLSFRGEDTRKEFTSELYSALYKRGIRTFIDDKGLSSGDEIDPCLHEAILDSAAAIAVISENYADSHWCLEELARLFECQKLVVPVFYKVNPSHVRRQKGTFLGPFEILRRDHGRKRVNRWKKALNMAGSRSGFVLDAASDKSQAIRIIVERIWKELSRIPVHVATYPVGLDSRIDEVIENLNFQNNGVQFLGIHGVPGIGKTTLAKAVFSKLVTKFKRRCFISNFKEKGVLVIQNKLLSDLSLEHGQPPVTDENSGKLKVRRVIQFEESGTHDMRVLIVVDDVVHADKLEAVGIERKWFAGGSRIIATSRDINVLRTFASEDELYEAKELRESEALELFSYHALRRKEPTEEFLSLSKEIVLCTGRLPLAIEVFGSVLLDKRTKKEWEISLEKLRKIRPSHLQDVLKVSFDALDREQKIIFLDISCLFIQVQMKRVDAVDILHGCGFNAEETIQVLKKKSLLKITQDDVLWMHDQIRDMGKQLVIEEGQKQLGDQSRFWNYDDIVNILQNNTGTENVRGIILDTGRKRPMVIWTPRTSSLLNFWRNCMDSRSEDSDIDMISFKSLAKLNLLQINDVQLKGDFSHMPPELRWLKWKGCHWKSLPSSLPKKIRVLDLSESKLEYLWSSNWMFNNKNQVIENLTVLNLSNCYHLTSIPDLSEHCKVRKLILEGCVKLSKIHESLGHMTSLIHLNLRRCTSLIELPRDISGLKDLEELILSYCSSLSKLPCDFNSLKSLIELHLDDTAITELPGLYHLTSLQLMTLNRCIKLRHLPRNIGNMRSLKVLSLSGSGVEILPDTIGRLSSLEELYLEHCSSLKSIPESVGGIKSLFKLYLTNTPLKNLPESCYSLPYLMSLSLANTSKILTLPASIRGLCSVIELHLDGIKITELPDEIGFLNVIQNLQLPNCTSLTSLPKSIGDLFSLTVLNLENTAIIELPNTIGDLENLVTLRLNRCKRLTMLPCTFGQLKSLCHLYMEETSINELPKNIGMLSNLVILKMKKKSLFGDHSLPQQIELPVSFGKLSRLHEFDARAWNIGGKIPENFNMLTCMETLDLGHNSFHSLPSDLQGLSNLQKLLLPHCQNLKLFPPLPSSLVELNAANCTALSCISDISNLTNLEELQLSNCNKLKDVPGLESLRSLRRLYMVGCDESASLVTKRLGKETYEKLSYLGIPGRKIPVWFCEDSAMFSSRVNSALKSVLVGVIVSVKIDSMKYELASSPLSAVQVKLLRAGSSYPIFSTTLSLASMPKTCKDQLYLCRFKDFHPLVSLLEDNDRLEMSLMSLYGESIELRRYGICFVYENDDGYDGNEELLEEHQHSVSMKLSTFFHSLDEDGYSALAADV